MDWHTIGEVSKLCKIPIRTLRYYDDIGLLKPDRISPDTNYRYYSKEGLRKIPLIKYYKQLGFKLEDIGRMLERQNFDVLEDFMAKELLVVEKQMAELRKKHFAIQEWHRLLKQGESLLADSGDSGEVRVAAFPLYRTMKFRYEVKEFQAADMEVLYSNILVELCHRYQVFAYGPFMLYFDDFGRRVDQSFTEVDCYTAVIEDQEYSSIRPLIDWLDYNGYTVVTKPTKEFYDASGRRKVKGNMDIELAVNMMEMSDHIDHLVLFSGDGDFRSVVEAVQRKGRKVSVISTLSTQPPMIADELRRQADHFIDLISLQSRIGRDPAERAARAAERAQAVAGFEDEFDE